MAVRFWHKLSIMIAMLGLFGQTGVRADDVDPSGFETEDAARAYLDQNPFGPRAKAAFLALVQFDLARNNPGFTIDEIRTGFADQSAPASSGTPVSSGTPEKGGPVAASGKATSPY